MTTGGASPPAHLAAGRYDLRALRAIDRLLCCHHTSRQTRMDPAALECLAEVDARLGGGNQIHAISAHRAPAYNEWLARHGRVSRRSLHPLGKAVDVRFPGIPAAAGRRAALSIARGGVGYYAGARFVHLDSGPPRSW